MNVLIQRQQSCHKLFAMQESAGSSEQVASYEHCLMVCCLPADCLKQSLHIGILFNNHYMHVPVALTALSRSHMHNETLRHKHLQNSASCSSIKDPFWCRGIFQRNLGLRGWWVDWVRDIVLNMHGQDLTALKNAMDDGGDAHNIHKLIYNDILVSFCVLQLFVETDMS